VRIRSGPRSRRTRRLGDLVDSGTQRTASFRVAFDAHSPGRTWGSEPHRLDRDLRELSITQAKGNGAARAPRLIALAERLTGVGFTPPTLDTEPRSLPGSRRLGGDAGRRRGGVGRSGGAARHAGAGTARWPPTPPAPRPAGLRTGCRACLSLVDLCARPAGKPSSGPSDQVGSANLPWGCPFTDGRRASQLKSASISSSINASAPIRRPASSYHRQQGQT
jgi:hypothetical protein